MVASVLEPTPHEATPETMPAENVILGGWGGADAMWERGLGEDTV